MRDGKRSTETAQKSISELEAKTGGVLIYNSAQNILACFHTFNCTLERLSILNIILSHINWGVRGRGKHPSQTRFFVSLGYSPKRQTQKNYA